MGDKKIERLKGRENTEGKRKCGDVKGSEGSKERDWFKKGSQ